MRIVKEKHSTMHLMSARDGHFARTRCTLLTLLTAQRLHNCSPRFWSVQAAGKDGQVVEEWDYLSNFFKRYNKVLLDVMAIEREKERLGSRIKLKLKRLGSITVWAWSRYVTM